MHGKVVVRSGSMRGVVERELGRRGSKICDKTSLSFLLSSGAPKDISLLWHLRIMGIGTLSNGPMMLRERGEFETFWLLLTRIPSQILYGTRVLSLLQTISLNVLNRFHAISKFSEKAGLCFKG